ncbi:WbqC family protein [Nostoc sp.]|uniref:WbqC family protein n=1 Tax=Nostoc sp. TaxID=1180 RepID=UPI002FFAD199
MIVTISQPRYQPWLGYFHRIAISDLFIYLDTVQYTPRDWENRNKVKTDRGSTWLTVPVKANYRAMIPEVLVDNEQFWQWKHWGTIKTYYGNSPYFCSFAERLHSIYKEKIWHSLTDLNFSLTDILCECLGLEQPQFIKATDLGIQGKGSELILNICKAVGATVYLSGSQGRNYMDEAAFADAGINIHYQDYNHPVYPQLHNEFLPNLAAIDLLFNCGADSLDILMSGQDEIKQ